MCRVIPIVLTLPLPLLAQGTVSRIAIRSVQGFHTKEFYDSTTGEPFVPRGNNYIRLANQPDPWNTNILANYHSTFDPGQYDRNAATAALNDMSCLGYNIVRVFINDMRAGRQDNSAGLSMSYLTNVADFLELADCRRIHVILTFPYMPKTGGYYPPPSNPGIEDINNFYLAQPFLDAKKRYLKDFIVGLQGLGAPMNAVFAYAIENEACYLETAKPLSLSSGMVLTANGGTYDMSSPADRQQMMDANLVHWINCVRQGIREADPSALVTVGFFSPAAVQGPDDPRVIRTRWAIADANGGGSSADFIDLHVYPGLRGLAAEMASFEIGVHEKPLLMGEFGAFTHLYPTLAGAAQALREFQVSTANEYGFSGWLLWTWDTDQQPGVKLFHALSGNGEIRDLLSPLVRPDPGRIIGAPRIHGITHQGSNVLVRWSGTDLTAFTLSFRGSLSTGTWSPAEPANQLIPTAKTLFTATNYLGGTSTARFFRIEAR
jgi:hypothetical protein